MDWAIARGLADLGCLVHPIYVPLGAEWVDWKSRTATG